MKLRRATLRVAAFLLGVSVVVASLASIPALDRLDDTSLDILTWLRHKTFGRAHEPAESPVVVVALDEETYRTPPFAGTPKVMWTQGFAAVQDAVIAGGAHVVGYDLILPASVEKHIPGFDRPFLISLRKAARAGRVLLAKAQHSDQPISPHPAQSFAVNHGENIRAVNLAPDPDGVIRRVPLWFATKEGKRETSFSLELAARALKERPVVTPDGVWLGGYEIPGGAGNAMAVNFEGGVGAIPTYSLADLFACAEAGRDDFFAAHFAGKVVFVGAVLDVEDRKLTTKRYVTGEEGLAPAARCMPGPSLKPSADGPRRETLPAVYVHASAVNNMLRGDALSPLPRALTGIVTLVLALAAGSLAFDRRIWRSVAGLLIGAVAWSALSTVVFRGATMMPLLDVPIAGVATYGAMLAFRLTVVDRKRLQLRRAFALYLSSAVIDRMLATDRLPTLGGEQRVLTVFFSDIAGFTAISERLDPEALVSLMNTYLAAMTDIIEEHGGFVDKYIGDAIVAVFGAPHDDPEHALSAARAALGCRRRLAAMQHEFRLPDDMRVDARIGLNTGTMLVGNIGSKRRFNYTVMGDAVNVAARLEGVNKQYGTSILVSETTAAGCGDTILFREIDRVRVKGRGKPTRLFEPVVMAEDATPRVRDGVAAYAAALADYRAGRFEDAAQAFDALADDAPAAVVLGERARGFAAAPPRDWDGVSTLETK